MNKKGPNTRVFAVLTIMYLLIAAWAALYIDSPKNASDWGDALSGLFSPLAFLWLLYASLAQRAELELQRQELTENNATQRQQQEQMQRQADALSAQVNRLVAQANAEYEPVFVFEKDEHVSTHTFVYLKNEGALIRDVRADSVSSSIEAKIASKGFISPVVRKGESIIVLIVPNMVSKGGVQFVIGYTRLDATRREQMFYVDFSKQHALLMMANDREPDIDGRESEERQS